MLKIEQLTIDAINPRSQAEFWQRVLHWNISDDSDEDLVMLTPPAGVRGEGMSPDLLFLKVPEVKTLKNRLHLDFRPDAQDDEVLRIEALGGRRISIGQDPSVTWVVMADPEGNEFCILSAFQYDELEDANPEGA
jgi:predicted enzyme related to lactoylglutathione lyase